MTDTEFRFRLAASHIGRRHVRLAVLRTIAHENETSTWPLLPERQRFPASFGDLTGLSFRHRPRNWNLPTVLGQLIRRPSRPAIRWQCTSVRDRRPHPNTG
jgi:hypothetical protein